MIVLKDRVKQIASAPVPTGTLTLGTTPNSYRSFSSVLSSGDETYYAIETSNSFEVGIGRYGIEGSNTLTRDTVLSSSTGSKLSLTGRATVFITVPAAKFPFVDPSGELNLALNTLNDVGLTAPASGQSLVYNGSSWANTTITGYTTEEAQDAVGGILADTSSISFSYNDGTPSISASVKNSGVTNDMLATGIDATKIGSGSVSSIEFGYLEGVTSSLQGQLDSKYDSANPSGYLTSSVASATYLPLAGGTLSGLTTVAYSNSGTTLGGASGIPSQGIALVNTNGGTSGNPFGILFGGTTGYHHSAIFGIQQYDVNNRSGDIVFATRPSSSDSSLTEAVRVVSNGYLEVGRPQPALKSGHVFNTRSLASTSSLAAVGSLTIHGEGSVVQHGGAGLCLAGPYSGTAWTTACGIKAAKTTATDGEYGFDMTFHTRVNGGASTEKMRLYTDGSLSFINDRFEIRRSTTAQTIQIYNTYTSSTSFENLQFKANAGAAYQIGSAIGSAGGSNRAIDLGRWDSAGTWQSSLLIDPTNFLVTVGTTQTLLVKTLQLTSTGQIRGDSGNITLSDHSTATTFGLLRFGGTTSSYPAIKRNGVGLEFRLADDSAVAGITAGALTLTQAVATSSSPTAFTLTGAAHTTLTLSTEATDVNFNLARTVQFATGALTTQRAMRIQAPTYGFVGASTITTASTLSISGAPVAGTNATITNAYALNVESGKSQFSGWTQIGTTDSWNTPLSVGGWVQMHASGYGELFFHCGNAAVLQYDVRVSTTGISVKNATSGSGFHWYAAGAGGATSLSLVQDASDVLAQRRGTNAQTFRIFNTYTSSTSGEYGQHSWVSNEYRVGSAVGSAGGVQRSTVIGAWNSAGTWTPAITVASTGTTTFANTLYVPAFSGMVIGNDVTVARDTTRTIELRSSTSAVTFAISNTYTSTTSYERLNVRGKASANFEIGPENGSAGGTLRGLTIGCYPAGTATIVGWAQFRPNASTGALEAFYLGPIADSTAVGGNARGANSVDLQTSRSAANQVASGTNSFVIGERNRASGRGGFCGGYQSAATGGYESFAFGEYSSASGGAGSWATGSSCSSTADYAHARGYQALANRHGMQAESAGQFAASGDAQCARFVLRRKTTDATATTLMLDGSSTRLTIPSGKKLTAFIIVSGVKSDGSACAEYMRKVSIKNVGGTTSLIGSVEAIGTDIEDNVLTDVTITADNTNDALDISVTGIAAETWRWVCTVEGLEIAYGV